MIFTNNDFHRKAIEKVRKLWHLYLLNEDSQLLVEEFGNLPDDLLMIGTGRHEFYKSKNEFIDGMNEDQLEARDIQFELQDEWYEVKGITDNVCIVYGSVWAREKVSPGKTVYVDLEGSRFSIICLNKEDGIEIRSIHHSMPYIDQVNGEYYPRSLSSLARELEHRIELDHMTELYSRYYMEQHVQEAMEKANGYFLVMDLDGFKHINDTKGHIIGDQVIEKFADLLRTIASSSAILGRMGGDEFAIWDSEIESREKLELKFAELLEGCKQLSTDLGVEISCSAGVAYGNHEEECFIDLYKRADEALYQAKSKGKACLIWAEKHS